MEWRPDKPLIYHLQHKLLDLIKVNASFLLGIYDRIDSDFFFFKFVVRQFRFVFHCYCFIISVLRSRPHLPPRRLLVGAGGIVERNPAKTAFPCVRSELSMRDCKPQFFACGPFVAVKILGENTGMHG